MSQRYNSEGAKPRSQIWSQLSNRGPQTSNELDITGGVSSELRHDGVASFKPSANSYGTAVKGGGQKAAVYYIRGKHSRTSVVQKWINENQKTLDEVGKKAVHWRICDYGQEWKEASREVLGKVGANNGGGAAPRGGTCSMCGKDYQNYLPDHLPECQG